MKNYTLKIVLFLCLGIISCNRESQSSEKSEDKRVSEIENVTFDNKTDKEAKTPETDEVPLEFMEICQGFYDNVCLGFSEPRPALNNDGIYILDMTTYKENLRSLNIFTTSFINKQDEIFSECIKALENDSITPDKVPDGIDVSAPFECGFFHYNYYLQSQESPDGFYLRNSKIKEILGVTEIHYYTKTDKSYFNWDDQVILSLELKKVDDTWKISNVQKIRPKK